MVIVDQAGAGDIVEPEEPATNHDITEGGVLGAVGGAVVGALAGGPIGGVVGAVLGGAASAAAVGEADKYDHDFVNNPDADPAAIVNKYNADGPNTFTGADYSGVSEPGAKE